VQGSVALGQTKQRPLSMAFSLAVLAFVTLLRNKGVGLTVGLDDLRSLSEP